MTYCTDKDLVKYRPNILDLGVESWATQREEAHSIINRLVNKRWYMTAAPIMGYDPTLHVFNPEQVEEGALTRLEAFKTLELAYMYLKKDASEEDAFERLEKSFRMRFNEELEMILAIGINYDFADDDTIDDDEMYIRAPRRLMRS